MDSEYEIPIKKSRSKPRVNREWEEDEVFKLIGLVESHECLWNPEDDYYHNKISRNQAWRDISDAFYEKYSPMDLNAKWTNLRIQYRGYAVKAKSRSVQGSVEAPKWRYFNAMSFVGRDDDTQNQSNVSKPVVEVDSDSNSTSTPTLTKPRRKQPSGMKSAATQIAETMREAVASLGERKPTALEPNTAFANYIVSELQTLPDDEAAYMRHKVTRFFLQCLEEERERKF